MRLDPPQRRSPPSGPGATDPTARLKDAQRIALEMPTPKREAAARHEDPASIAATTRSRRSTDSAFDMPVGPLPTGSLNQIRPASGKDFREFSQVGRCSR